MQQPGDAVVTLGDLTLHRWGRDDLPVLERANTPEMTAFLGGPESEEKVRDRHERYLRYWDDGEARMFVIRMDGVEESVGSVGYWLTTWRDRPVYEAGWGVDSAYQGRGIASRALRACLDDAAAQEDRTAVVAFPRTDNVGSNALCRTVGFVCAGEEGFEYPKGHPIRVNAWVYDLA